MKVELLRGAVGWRWCFSTFTYLDIFLKFLSKSIEEAFLYEGRQSLRSLILSIKVNIPHTVFSSLPGGVP